MGQSAGKFFSPGESIIQGVFHGRDTIAISLL